MTRPTQASAEPLHRDVEVNVAAMSPLTRPPRPWNISRCRQPRQRRFTSRQRGVHEPDRQAQPVGIPAGRPLKLSHKNRKHGDGRYAPWGQPDLEREHDGG